MDCLTSEPQRAARAEPRLPATAALPGELRQQSGGGSTTDLDQAVERVRLYLRCLDLAENADVSRLLSQTVRQAERRLQSSEPADPAVVMLDELHRLLPAEMPGEPASAAVHARVPVPTPPPCPRHMAEQRLDYCAPMRALRDQVLALVELVFPRLRRYGQ